MSNLMKAELFKLRRNKTFIVLMLFIFGLSTLLHSLIVTEWWYMTGTPFELANLNELNALIFFTVPLFFNFIVSTLAGFFIATEFTQNNAIKNEMISGNKRSQIFIAKYCVFTVGAQITTIVLPLVSAIVVVKLVGTNDVLSAESLIYLGKSYSLFTIHFLSFTAIVLLFAIWTEDSGRTILFTLVLSIAMFLVEKFVTNEFVKTIYEHTFFYQFTESFKYTMTDGEIVKSIVIGVVSFILIMLFGIVTFHKKEVK